MLKGKILAIIMSALFWACPATVLAGADIMVYPSRVVMTDRQRSAQVEIVNSSQVQASYRIAMVRKRMTLNGEFADVATPEPEEKFADEVVKFSPRQVTLVPGAGQTIRLMFKVTPELERGEYRSHLVVTKAPAAITVLPEKEEIEPNTVVMRLTASVGVSIPVIARHGELQARLSIDPASVAVATLAPGQQVVELALLRSGTRSVYGDLLLFRGKEKVAEADGLAVYVPNRQRNVRIRLQNSTTLSRGDTLRIVFTEPGENKPIAETAVVIP